uniref:LITAF domain-containing protein n=1 Tax=Euplotes harpa TaxID=151035 RepID=A0A7S3NAI6_9SPIT|mmetsp:Transcript_29913/g.34262  ORF Transcript_29913/g.34262 Transcript_29913/m.34262 type:complete len:114 (+) Transcript_29913:39-380(+)
MSNPNNAAQGVPVDSSVQQPIYENQNPGVTGGAGGLDFTLQAHPVMVNCPHCNKQGMTKVQSRIGMMQWIICLVLCLMGFWCCCCIPFYISDLRDATHACSQCNTVLGTSRPH